MGMPLNLFDTLPFGTRSKSFTKRDFVSVHAEEAKKSLELSRRYPEHFHGAKRSESCGRQ